MADKILGIGSPLVDIIQKKDDRFIKEHQLIKGGMKLVDEKTSETVFRALDNPSRACGGSAMNTIKGMAGLENAAKFCGCIGDDELGNFIYQTLTAVNITAALYKTSAALTGRVIAVITPDDERSFATYLGAANKLTADMITDDLFTDTSFLYLEGYLIYNEKLITAICRQAKAKNIKIALDLASFNVVADFRQKFQHLLENYIDIIFANEEEAKALTGKEEKHACAILMELADIAVVKLGKKGSLIGSKDEIYEIAVKKVNSLDTTGAGDLYAAGFLHGLLNNNNLYTCGTIASITAREVIKIMGTDIPASTWQKIKQEIKSL